MEKKELTTQFDEILSIIKSWLERARKETFKFYIKIIKPKTYELLGNVKDTIKHSDLDKKLKKKSFTKSLSSSRLILWLGIAAIVTGLLILLSPDMFIAWQLFIVLFITFIGPRLWDFFQESSEEAKDTLGAYEGRQFIGKVHRLKKPIVNGKLEITVKEKTWILRGDDASKGTRVKIVAVSKENIYVVGVE